MQKPDKPSTPEPLVFDDFEVAYETLAKAIDDVGASKEALFLTKLVLLLAHQQGDLVAFQRAVGDAMADV